MNYENNAMLTSPNLSYTSRDYASIYNELINSIPLLSKSWNPTDENDPGVVLIKLIAMLGDMLSYNLDKQALEAFPRTVLQRANAQQIFRLLGYKMHWWRSAKVEARFTNSNVFPVYIGRYNTFSTQDNKIVYTNTSEIMIPAGAYGDASYKVELIQGTPITPRMKYKIKPNNYNDEWHTCYDYNVLSTDIVNNRLYLNYANIDETSITLIDNDETAFASNEWKLVKNINLSENMDKVFEFDVDENNVPFIQFPNYWQEKFVITKFKLFVVLSNGKNGEIEENTLTGVNSKKCYVTDDNIDISSALELVNVYNSSSTYGYDPQTCTEARLDAEKYINTIDTLVTLKDFEKAVKRIDSVANVIATDIQIDPSGEEMTENQINLYIVRKSDYNNSGSDYIYRTEDEDTSPVDELFKENIAGELVSYKTIPTEINILLENYIDWIDWSLTGQIFLRTPINSDQNYDLMVRINDNLKNRFNCETLDFNEPINYMDAIECVMKTDKNIWHVDLNTSAIQYYRAKRSNKGNPTGFTVKNKYMIYNSEGKYTGYYATSLGCTSIEINKLPESIDKYNDIYDETILTTGYLAGTNNNDVTKTVKLSSASNIVPGGSGYDANTGNRIIREDGNSIIIGLFGDNEPREYEIYNKLIYDWSGKEAKFTGYVIEYNEDKDEYVIKYYNDSDDELEDSNFSIKYDSRIYLPDGSDSGEYLKHGYCQITPLCNNDKVITRDDILSADDSKIKSWLSNNDIREVYIIMNRSNEEIEMTNKVIDIETGEIYMQRGDYWYTTNRAYDTETGNIVDTFGNIIFNEDTGIEREIACREDITGEYIQFYDIKDNQTEFSFYLGQKSDGKPELDSKGVAIKAYPIKPYSLYIYIDGDKEILADTGSGNINGTPGLLNGQGTIDYSTGLVEFKLNIVPQSIKIMYKVNKFTYAKYVDFDTAEFFVRPEYIRSDIRR